MSDALFAKLTTVDRNIANEYKRIVKDGVIDVEGLKKIILKIIDPNGPKGGDISSAEAQALVLIIESGELDDNAKRSLDAALRTVLVKEKIVNGAAVELKKNDPELAGFHSAFAIKNTGKVKFYSKGTNLTYSPFHYQAIAQLVKDGKIKVIKVLDRGLSATVNVDAFYVASTNTFFFNEHKGEADFFSDAPTIVHEATHAVQDWFDIPSSVTLRFVETDAYIAQSVASPPGTPMSEAFKAAAKFVVDGRAVKDNQAWYDAYDAVTALVDRHPNYGPRKDEPTNMAEEGGDELKEFQRVLDALNPPAGKPKNGAKTKPAAKP